MIDNITRVLKPFQQFLFSKFRQDNPRVRGGIEMLLMLACGHISNQLSEVLGIDKSKIYGTIKSWSIYLFRRMFLVAGFSEASRLIKKNLSKSPATQSRARITLSVDDTVIDRLGITYSWFSGKHHKVVKGQNIISITIKIGDRIIPLCIRPVGKQGRGNTSKPQVFREMIGQILELFSQEGIDLTQFPITFDSWYGSRELVDILEEYGFHQILIHAKSN